MSNMSIDSILQASNAIIINPSKSLKDFGIDTKEKERKGRKRTYVPRNIAKQQAAIKKQQEINRKLEILIRESDVRNERNQREIIRLREQIKNLEEVIELLGKTSQQVA